MWSSCRILGLTLLLAAGSCGGDAGPENATPESVTADRQNGPVGAETESSAPPPPSRRWRPIANDHIHDPKNPALELLQEPAEALSVLPEAHEGNQVDWAAALRSGMIDPRTNIFPETKVNILDLDILFEETAGQPMVLFPHRPHTEWLDCNNCHDKIFVAKKGANDIGMLDILNGRFCGQCHGAVSFPLTQCFRCHSVDRKSTARPAPQPAVVGQ